MSPARRKPASTKQSCKPRCPASDSNSDSDNDYGGDNDKVSLERYRALQLAWACATWEHNVRAIRELRALFEGVYTKRADKAVQGAMLEDLMVALAQAERMGRLDGALDGLVTAALRVLPKQKRNAVATAHRRAAVQQRREARRRHSPDGTPRAESDDNSSEGGDGSEGGGVRLPSLHDLPLEVTETVFEHLGPVELGRCACVSRSWREVAVSSHMDMVWRQLFHLTFPRSALVAAAGPGGVGAPLATAYTVFCRAAQGTPRRLARWSGRVLRAGTLRWVCTDDLRRLPACAFRELGFPTESQVVQWACGKRNVGASSSSSGESSDDDDGSDSDYEPSSSAAGERLARMKLWALPAVP